MSRAFDILNPRKPKRVAIVASNPSVSKQTGWPIGFWWSELTDPYWEFAEHGYQVDIYRPDGGKLEGDSWSDPRDESKYSVEDLISLGFICSQQHSGLVANSRPISQLKVSDYDAVLIIGGQGPMYTFFNDAPVHDLAAESEYGREYDVQDAKFDSISLSADCRPRKKSLGIRANFSDAFSFPN
jgi:hypothetical protein